MGVEIIETPYSSLHKASIWDFFLNIEIGEKHKDKGMWLAGTQSQLLSTPFSLNSLFEVTLLNVIFHLNQLFK